ncbi:hypothetical protein SPRG_10532 [Saprolegnia parasitica CBS 223.65]|uniref:Uncharacterized protein n=1 Tax=Saprolegnia parasitica (strain CBS 223.65) TaxID=695850 RepID=A0A067C3Q9_SAPPC|nr:hypothetical protein SPRG_10532 [Saprolegnia parasitica CBS 223.65]KDO23755.1 hypothetical protein SPRG_10532 [Saprolegnia parasitica CBS 223.65]|eukprot:XP_012205571.1 hypothetical protein SPRG_10532 [Saprolegnia parasitica CBS 223.65]
MMWRLLLLAAFCRAESPHDAIFAALHSPPIEILSPTQNQVLESSSLSIGIVVREPSRALENPQVCVGVAPVARRQSSNLSENCFEQTNMTTFHATNLEPGTRYHVNVQLVDRGNVIAMSLRHFRVAAVPLEHGYVTVEAALEAAEHLYTDGQLEAAMAVYERILAQVPDHEGATYAYIVVLVKAKQDETLISVLGAALQRNPSHAMYHNLLAISLRRKGQLDAALDHWRRAIALDPNFVLAQMNLGSVLQDHGYLEAALPELRAVVHRLDDLQDDAIAYEAVGRLCSVFIDFEEIHNAQQCLSTALERWPTDAQFRIAAGNLFWRAYDVDAALDQYAIVEPDVVPAMVYAAVAREHQGDAEGSAALLDKAQALAITQGKPFSYIQVLRALVLPWIHPSDDRSVDAVRAAMEASLDALTDLQPDDMAPSRRRFSLALPLHAHLRNNKHLRAKIADAFRGLLPAGSRQVAAQRFDSPHFGAVANLTRTRVGFVGRLARASWLRETFSALIQQLDTQRFEVFLFTLDAKEDGAADYIEHVRARIVVVADAVAQAAAIIRSCSIDVLVYPSLGDDATTYALSLLRLATVQAVWYGLPETSGVPTIDYALTSTLEAAGHEDHYTEALFPLTGFGLFVPAHEPAPVPAATVQGVRTVLKQIFDWPVDDLMRVYILPSDIVSMHADMVVAIKRLLRLDGSACVLIASADQSATLERQLLERIGLHSPRVQFSRLEFSMRVLMRGADVVLQPLYTPRVQPTIHALREGIPIVTLPKAFWRTRLAAAMLEEVGVADVYVRRAIQLASKRALRDEVIGRLVRGRDVLFEDETAVSEWTRFFTFASDGPPSQRQPLLLT